jgi:hypothetical protein
MKTISINPLPFWNAQVRTDWFEDPGILSDWLVEQQQRVVFESPLAVSPFADLAQGLVEKPQTSKKDSNIVKDVLSINVNAFKNLLNPSISSLTNGLHLLKDIKKSAPQIS